MALITRLTRLFQADFHAVLDSIEEPDIQLRQAIREMEFELQQEEQAVALLKHESIQLDTALKETDKKIQSFDEELDLCLEAGKDDLARDLVRRKLESESYRETASNRAAGIARSLEQRQQQIEAHRQQLDNMKQKLELLAKESSPDASSPGQHATTRSVRSEEVEIALLREKKLRAKS